jgi:hypothetical protein
MSKVEVNTIEPQCGTTLTVGKCTSTVAVPGNVVKSNALQASDGGNIVSQSGTDITLGASGDTINLASGASQTGFGRTGTVDWQTGAIKTATFTAATGEGYFCDTTSGVLTVNLPAGVAGSIVSLADYARKWATNNVTVSPNGSEKIGAAAADATLSIAGQSVTFVYIDSTQGWLNVQDSTSNIIGLTPFVHATGGTITCSGDYKFHTFTGPGTFCVSSLSPSAPENAVDWLVAAGGGGGGGRHGGGGGAGGYRESPGTATGSYTVSPLGAAPAAAITVAVQEYPITVGGGGTGSCYPSVGTNGAASNFSTYPSAGGGYGSTYNTCLSGSPGGSGGGGGSPTYSGGPGGTGNTPPVTPAQGTNGGAGSPYPGTPAGEIDGGGGGGATVAGDRGSPSCAAGGGPGGTGATSSINATPTERSGGGGGGGYSGDGPLSGTASGGGGAGGGGPNCAPAAATAGTANTGGGGGGYGGSNPSGAACLGANGGSGVVILRYKFQ